MQDKFNEIYEFLQKPKTCYLIGKNLKEQIDKTLVEIHKCLIKREDPTFPKEAIESLRGILTVTVESEITADLKKFIFNYSFILNEWNKEFYENNDISTIVKHLLRFSKDELFVDEFLHYFNEVSVRLMQSANLELMPHKLSEHYFNLICED